MPRPLPAGLIAGFVFGVVLTWQGAGAAGLVLMFTLIGWLVGAAAWLVWRVSTGQIDVAEFGRLASTIFLNRPRR